ncbi:Thiamin pyrophosphokinase [Nadsonia fulvescens var. elongata DSM 6958]|uniref:Thiamine pyrophosphokinase n=1 Tax=Nadsonia fulvescens var. elongata DSM 6958 TaxID=857566 RepID=A0A1E3PMN0_9ASCO|nr:Thiamin pyrophosphokinase [Nadsonia fulvescens var. elongata DSM 6958]
MSKTLYLGNFLRKLGHGQASSGADVPGNANRALIILNQPITSSYIFESIWKYCSYRMCADGGANRLYDYLANDKSRVEFLPDAITGDFDSVRPDVLAFYESHKVFTQKTPDQYSTDFMKCVALAMQRWKPTFDIFALGALGGRVDQSFHSIHQLHLSLKMNQICYLITDECITLLLDRGVTYLHLARDVLDISCGLLPVNGTTVITTQGLEWDVKDWPTDFGSQVSTSNHVMQDIVKVQTDKPIVFTVEIKQSLK